VSRSTIAAVQDVSSDLIDKLNAPSELPVTLPSRRTGRSREGLTCVGQPESD